MYISTKELVFFSREYIYLLRLQMAYNLQNRSIQLQMIDEESNGFDDVASWDEEDHVSEYSEDQSESADEEISEENLQNASLQKRLLQSRARGRPQTKLRGKDKNYVWSTRVPAREAGRQYVLYLHIVICNIL